MYNIASSNVISIEYNNSELLKKSIKPINTSILTRKKVNFRRNRKEQRKKDQIITAIVVDSMVKDIYRWELSDNYENVAVKQFTGSTTEDMMTYIKSPLKCNPDRFIIHIGTNDLRSDKDRETIVRNVVDVANNSKTDINKKLISSIVSRRDNLNGKVRQFIFLKKFCMENDFAYVNHGNIKPRQHCNYGGVYLNNLGL